jgi:hypothetical protein
MRFEKGQTASVELFELLPITIGTENLMTYFRETSGGRQTNITSTNDGDLHFAFTPDLFSD